MSYIKIAVADDAQLMCSAFTYVINEFENCKVILQAHSGIELIKGLSQLQQLPDICIIETNNRILNNYNTLIDLQNKFPGVKVLAVSIYDLEYTIIKMIQHGIKGYLLKSCSAKQLCAAINHLHTNDYYYSDVAPVELFMNAMQETLPVLSKKELKLLSLKGNYVSEQEIADVLAVEEEKIDGYFDSIIEKLKVNDLGGLAVYIMQSGLVAKRQHLYT